MSLTYPQRSPDMFPKPVKYVPQTFPKPRQHLPTMSPKTTKHVPHTFPACQKKTIQTSQECVPMFSSYDDGFFRPCAKTLHFEVSKFSDQKRHAKIIAGMSPTSFGRAFRRLPGNTLARCDSCGVRTRSRVIDWASTPWRTCQC